MVDDFDTLDDGIGRSGLSFSPQDNSNLLTAAKWARFVGIVILSMCALGIISMIFNGNDLLMAISSGPGAIFGSVGLLMYLIIFAVAIFMGISLFQFGTNTMKAIRNGSGLAMSDGLKSLKNYFLVVGIFFAIYLAFMVFGILFFVIASL